MTSLAPSGALDDFTCGDPAPDLQFQLTLEPELTYRERLVSVVSTPHLDVVKDRCMYSGLSYSVDVALADIDHGKPIDSGYDHPLTGKPLDPWKPGKVGRKPICRCDLRDSGREWVESSEDSAASLK